LIGILQLLRLLYSHMFSLDTLGGIGFDHTNHQEVAVHLLRTYHVVEPISEVAGQYVRT